MEADPERLAALTGDDDSVRAAAWEGLVLEVLGIDAANPPIDRWAAVYEDISAQLAVDPETAAPLPSTQLRSERGDPAAHEAVWGLIYAARTFLVAHRLLNLVPGISEGSILDIGAGWGPFALAAALRAPAAPVVLLDVSRDRLANARELFRVARVRDPDLCIGNATASEVQRLAQGQAPALISFAHSLGEVVRGISPAAAASMLRAECGLLAPEGKLWILEPGTRPSARRIQTLRDALVDRVIAPCAATPTCPLLANPKDWCHFTWRLPLGPLGQQIADRAHRRWQETHFSWLTLAAQATRTPAQSARVLEHRRTEKSKISLRLCTSEGAKLVTGLKRDREVFSHLEGLEPGTEVRRDSIQMELRGDGFRVRDQAALQVLQTPGGRL